MHPATRQQKDYPFDAESIESALDCATDPEGKSVTRQEQAPDTDANRILSQYGIPYGRPMTFGEVNYNLSLQEAYEHRDTYMKVYAALPQPIKDKYPSFMDVMRGLDSGQLQADIQQAAEAEAQPKPTTAPTT